MDTSVPGQQDASDAALVDMLMLEAPVGLDLFGSDLRFRWVNAALTRLSERSGEDPSAPSDPHPDPSACGPPRCGPSTSPPAPSPRCTRSWTRACRWPSAAIR